MSDWTISVAQLPVVGFGPRFHHNIIVVKDASGRLVYEMNGGPADANGNIIPLDDPRSALAYTSGQFPVGAQGSEYPIFYRPGLQEHPVLSGTQAEVLRRVDAAKACIDAITSAARPYTLTTGPKGGREDATTPTFNSNSVNASLLQCMGIPVGNPAISNQLGFDNPILDADEVRRIREEQNAMPPPAVPAPRTPGNKRNEIINDQYGSAADRIAGKPAQQQPADETLGPLNPSPARAQSIDRSLRGALPPQVATGANYLAANGVPVTHRSMYLASVYGPQRVVDAINSGQVGSLPAPLPDEQTQRQIRSWVQGWHGIGPAVGAENAASASSAVSGAADDGPDDWIVPSYGQ